MVLFVIQQPELNDDSAFKEPYPPSFDPLVQGDSAVNVGVTGASPGGWGFTGGGGGGGLVRPETSHTRLRSIQGSP